MHSPRVSCFQWLREHDQSQAVELLGETMKLLANGNGSFLVSTNLIDAINDDDEHVGVALVVVLLVLDGSQRLSEGIPQKLLVFLSIEGIFELGECVDNCTVELDVANSLLKHLEE